MNKKDVLIFLEGAEQILQEQIYAVKNDPEYPKEYDITTISSAKFALEKVELLLKNDESKQPQPPDFANTMLGEMPTVVSPPHDGSHWAVEGATPVVRQNEQTKEVCPKCSQLMTVIRYGCSCEEEDD